MSTQSPLNRQIAETAASWAVALDDGPLSPEQKSELLAWLKTSPVHLEEFLTALSLLEGVTYSNAETTTQLDDILEDLAANVVALDARKTTSRIDAPRKTRKQFAWAGGAIAAGVAAALVVSFYVTNAARVPDASQERLISTALGEQRSVTLEDNSIVYVNTQSEIAVDYTQEFRTVEIKHGEALFDVQNDEDRPFRVVAGDTIALAIGTSFNVRYIDNQAEVSVIEGVVAFERRDSEFDAFRREERTPDEVQAEGAGKLEDGRIILVAGESAGLDQSSAVPVVNAANTDAVSAWTTRRLMFEDDTLGLIATEFNRYNRAKIIVTEPLVSDIRISGVFAADDPDSLIDFLELTNEVRIQEIGSDIYIQPLSAG